MPKAVHIWFCTIFFFTLKYEKCKIWNWIVITIMININMWSCYTHWMIESDFIIRELWAQVFYFIIVGKVNNMKTTWIIKKKPQQHAVEDQDQDNVYCAQCTRITTFHCFIVVNPIFFKPIALIILNIFQVNRKGLCELDQVENCLSSKISAR